MAYKKKVWKTGDIMKQEDINNIENGIYEAHQELQNLHNMNDTEIKNNRIWNIIYNSTRFKRCNK